jgi:NAD(P)-dependent dehydrogenase (short-subunit alcohol dehydrogenase family)
MLDLFKINVVGPVHLFNLTIPLVLKGRAKKVIAISTGMADIDITAKYDLDLSGPYSISKVALNMAIAKFSAEYSKDGVLFLSVSPGLVDTGLNNNGEFLI